MKLKPLVRWRQTATAVLAAVLAGPAAAPGADSAYTLSDAAAQLDLPKVVAVVNGQEIPSDHVRFEFNRILRDFPRKMKPKDQRMVVKGIIENEIVRELVYQQAKAEGVQVTSEEIEDTLKNLKKGYPDDKAWKEALKARGIDEARIRHSIEQDLMARQLLENQVRGKVEITDAQVKNFYEEHQDRFRRPEAYRAQHIFIAYIPADKRATLPEEQLKEQADSLRADARKRIEAVQEKLNQGESFENLARQFSEDAASASKGGDLGFIYKGVFDPAFDEAVNRLKPGETSDIVESSFGYHLIRLMETREPEQVPFEEVKAPIQRYLFTQDAKKIIDHYINLLRKKATIETRYRP